jgi:F-type H+-transporting ATPase subunit a
MHHYSPRFEWAGLVFDIPTMIMTVVTSLIVLLLIMFSTRAMTERVPQGMQNFFEWVFDFVRGIAANFMDRKTANKFVALALTLFLYIFLGNQLGLIMNVITVHNEPSEGLMHMLTLSGTEERAEEKHHHIEEELKAGHGVEVAWWKSPTASPSVTFSLMLIVLLYSHYLAVKVHGMRGTVAHYFKPHPLMVILHAMEDFIIKPLTLPLRLFGNIFAGEVLIVVLLGGFWLASMAPLVVWLGYSVFVGAVQAFIFTTLAMVYIGQKVEDAH